MATPVRLLDLPTELHKDILDLLDPLEHYLLRGTCRYFRELVAPLSMAPLLDIEHDWNQNWKRWEPGIFWNSNRFPESHVYACCLCNRLKLGRRFADRMLKGGVWANGRGFAKQRMFCFDCGTSGANVGHGGYTPGSMINFRTKRYVICTPCKQCRFCARDWSSDQCGKCAMLQ